MITPFERVQKNLVKTYGKDRTMSLATSVDDVPSVRAIDAYYFEGSMYIVTYESSKKVKEIQCNPNVCLCNNENFFYGKAQNIGHPLKERNIEIREHLTKAFNKWYFLHNDENDPLMCYVQVELENAEVNFGKTRYKISFVNSIAEKI